MLDLPLYSDEQIRKYRKELLLHINLTRKGRGEGTERDGKAKWIVEHSRQ